MHNSLTFQLSTKRRFRLIFARKFHINTFSRAEGTRTRSGCPGKPKTGIVSIVTSCLDQGLLDDVTAVPVCISYDKLIDGNFHKEMMVSLLKVDLIFFDESLV